MITTPQKAHTKKVAASVLSENPPAPQSAPLRQVAAHKKSFGKNHVLRGINLTVHSGECLVILGPSGSGKSTLLRCVNRLEEPTSGAILFHGTPITEKNIQKTRQRIGMVFQHFNLINNLTVMDNLILAPVKLGLLDPDTATQKATRLLSHIGLTTKKHAYPASLSGGQKQRIAIIRTMMMDPEIILMDEPTSALDPESIGDVLTLIRELAREGLTLLLVTHEINFARSLATRVIFLDQGKIIEDASPTNFFTHPTSPRVREFLDKVL